MSTDQDDDPFSSKQPDRSQPPLSGLPSDGTQQPSDQLPPHGHTPAGGATPPPGSGTTKSVSGTGPTPPPSGSPYGTPESGSPYGTPAAAATPPPSSGSPYDTPPASGGPDFSKPGAGGTGSPYDTTPPPSYPGGGAGAGGIGGFGVGQYAEPDPRLAGMPPLASLGKRLVARIIDSIIIGLPMSLILSLLGIGYDFDDSGAYGRNWVGGFLTIAAYFVYEGLMLTKDGQTVGKKLMKIRVAMLDNGAVPAGNAGWIRAAVYSLPQLVTCIGTLFWLYNVLSACWDKPFRQAVHDKIAKTVVVEAQPTTAAGPGGAY
ncbi:RDD family protein [Streptomyces sp. A7024]|uniref:RDD family protein n=1 Tax=Streptomyces coryli TaxID=1128680 RepID=A0A6G4UD73_9ACTN|nr:RDD family protein [Streptomyces coryli]NGN69151.1 RDD family protein [Streptomyces coryli]